MFNKLLTKRTDIISKSFSFGAGAGLAVWTLTTFIMGLKFFAVYFVVKILVSLLINLLIDWKNSLINWKASVDEK